MTIRSKSLVLMLMLCGCGTEAEFGEGSARRTFALEISSADTIDLVTCQRERPDTRQFCLIKTEPLQLRAKIRTQAEVRGVRYDLATVLRSGKITRYEPAEKPGDPAVLKEIQLESLHPAIRMAIDWNSSAECRRCGLWSDNRVFVSLLDGTDPSREQVVLPVSIGLQHHVVELAKLTNPPLTNWSLNATDVETSDLVAGLRFVDAQYTTKLPIERIPSSCKMLLSDVQLGFQTEKIGSDLQTLSVATSLAKEYLVKTTEIHNAIVEEQRKSLCLAYNTAALLRDQELVMGFDELSMSSQNAVSDRIRDAVSIGAILVDEVPLTDGGIRDFWGYFVHHPDTLQAKCDKGFQLELKPESFVSKSGIVNHRGWQNATDHGRMLDNLRQIILASVAIASIAGVEIDKESAFKWMDESKIFELVNAQ